MCLRSDISYCTKQNISKCPRNCFQDHSDTSTLSEKNPRAKWQALWGQKQTETEAGVGNSCLLPPSALFPEIVMCDIVFLCGYISCTHILVGWQDKESRLQLPVAPNFPALEVGKPPWQPWRNAPASLHKDCPFWAQLHPLPLKSGLVSTVEWGIGKRRWPELKWRNKKEQMDQFWDVLLMLLPSLSLLFF